MRLGREFQRKYTIDGVSGWTLRAVMAELPDADENVIGKRLRAGANTWEQLRRPAKQSNRPPREPKRTLEDLARELLQRIEHETGQLWLTWRGPVAPSQLVVPVGLQVARPEHVDPCGRPPMRIAA